MAFRLGNYYLYTLPVDANAKKAIEISTQIIFVALKTKKSGKLGKHEQVFIMTADEKHRQNKMSLYFML